MPFTPRDWVVLASSSALGASAFYVLLPKFIRPLVRALLAPRYGFRVRGRENVPRTGPVLLAASHQSWLDGFVLAALSLRAGKAMVNAGFVNLPVFRQLAVRAGIIPTPFSGPRAIRVALQGCRAVLDEGGCVGIFPEGQISRNGLPGPYYRGVEIILRDRPDVAVIPVALDNLWGSIFSRSGGAFFWKRPVGLRRTINVVFGPPVPPPVTVFALRQAMMETMVHAYELRTQAGKPLETLDPALPRWEHPTLGLLTASAADVHYDDIHQIGQKPGSVGHPVPGVAVRAVDESRTPLPAETEGRIEVLRAGHPGWTDTGRLGRIDPDGFVRLVDGDSQALTGPT